MDWRRVVTRGEGGGGGEVDRIRGVEDVRTQLSSG